MKQDVRHLSVLVEQVIDQNRAVLEAVGDMQKKVAKLDGIEQDVAELKQDVKVVRAAVTDLSRDFDAHKHDDRIHFIPSVPRPRRA